MKTMINKNNGTQKCNMNKHKAMRISDGIFQNNNKLFLAINPKQTLKMELADNLWIPFLDQPHPNVVVLSILYLYKYNSCYRMETCNRSE